MSSKHCGFSISPRIRPSSPSSHLAFRAEVSHQNISNVHGELSASFPLVSPGQQLRFSNAKVGKGASRRSKGPQEARHGGYSESQTGMGVEPVLRAGGIYGLWTTVCRKGKPHTQGSVVIKSLWIFCLQTIKNMMKINAYATTSAQVCYVAQNTWLVHCGRLQVPQEYLFHAFRYPEGMKNMVEYCKHY